MLGLRLRLWLRKPEAPPPSPPPPVKAYRDIWQRRQDQLVWEFYQSPDERWRWRCRDRVTKKIKGVSLVRGWATEFSARSNAEQIAGRKFDAASSD